MDICAAEFLDDSSEVREFYASDKFYRNDMQFFIWKVFFISQFTFKVGRNQFFEIFFVAHWTHDFINLIIWWLN